MSRLFMLMLVAVLAAVSGCMSYGPYALDGRVFNKSSGAIRARYETAQMEEKTRQGDLELAQAYTQKELAAVTTLDLSASGTVPVTQAVPVGSAPVVLFRNHDRYKVYATVKPVGVDDRVADRWDIEIEAGATAVFPNDYPEATKFRCQNYGVTYWRDRSRGYSSSVQYYVGSFTVTPKQRGYDTVRRVYYNGGFDFTPVTRRD